MEIKETEYLEQRLDDQINWYGKKSASNQAAYKRLRLIEIIAASSIPLLAGYSQISGHVGMTIGVIIGVMGLIVAVIAGIVSLYRFQENWNEFRASGESLKQEKYLYLARVEPYDGEQPFVLLVQRVEALLKSETTGWAQAMRVAGAADKAEREPATEQTP
jgi:ABC-type bacteriocin/lantibiotic exporter with double-glycine peptidase domain